VGEPTVTSTTSTTVAPTLAVEPGPVDSLAPEVIDPPSTDTTIPPDEILPDPPPPPPAPVVWVAIAPSSTSTPYPKASGPVLAWVVTGAASVVVEGPSGGQIVQLGNTPSGSVRVCPSGGTGPVCVTALPGPYEYVVRAYDAGGVLVGTGVATLTIVV
jgi:hypothetical protein